MRVYRERPERKLYKTSSLIICEGVSAESQISHTWNKSSLIICEGVSRLSGSIKTKTAVPSLYVRVYRYINTLTGKNHGSLIICEGVSVFPGRFQNQNLFPHYM